jgi:hypothetical protein
MTSKPVKFGVDARIRAAGKARYRKRGKRGRWSLADAVPLPRVLYPSMTFGDPTPHATRLREILARPIP